MRFDQIDEIITSNQVTYDKEYKVVRDIIKNVQLNGDFAVKAYTKKFDQVMLDKLLISNELIEEAYQNLDQKVISALELAAKNIEDYHQAQAKKGYKISTNTSYVGQRIVPLNSVGLYVPGGTAAYPSSVLMNAIPAKIAGVKRIVMITPPSKDGGVKPGILAAARIAGVDEIYQVGGAQGIAALAYGTDSIQPVDKIVGPGNIYVALAKKEVFGDVGIDMIAGPSEILIYADEKANPTFVAADLLSQAEHDTLARSILVTSSQTLIDQVNEELKIQIDQLSRKTFMLQSLKNNGLSILVDDEDEAAEVINLIAPEHCEILINNPNEFVKKITNAGAIFIGPYSPEPLGDYLAGPNHTLPTSRTARFSSALGVDDFIKKISIINYSKEDLLKNANVIMTLAEYEGLDAHKRAIEVRTNED